MEITHRSLNVIIGPMLEPVHIRTLFLLLLALYRNQLLLLNLLVLELVAHDDIRVRVVG